MIHDLAILSVSDLRLSSHNGGGVSQTSGHEEKSYEAGEQLLLNADFNEPNLDPIRRNVLATVYTWEDYQTGMVDSQYLTRICDICSTIASPNYDVFRRASIDVAAENIGLTGQELREYMSTPEFVNATATFMWHAQETIKKYINHFEESPQFLQDLRGKVLTNGKRYLEEMGDNIVDVAAMSPSDFQLDAGRIALAVEVKKYFNL